ncbi:MAG TPA: hypothetical protein VGK46_04675 [Saprospiraceae bacterium]
MTKSFDSWFEDLVSNYVWAEPAQMHHRPETFKKIAHKVYMQEVASGVFRPIQEARKHVYNIICNTPGDAKKVDWAGKALKEMEQDKEPVIEISEEEIQRRLAEWQNSLSNVSNNFTPRFPLLDEKEEGQEEPKKPVGKPYPYTPLEKLRQKELHLRYIRENYEPTNGQPKSNWLPESEWIKNNL